MIRLPNCLAAISSVCIVFVLLVPITDGQINKRQKSQQQQLKKLNVAQQMTLALRTAQLSQNQQEQIKKIFVDYDARFRELNKELAPVQAQFNQARKNLVRQAKLSGLTGDALKQAINKPTENHPLTLKFRELTGKRASLTKSFTTEVTSTLTDAQLVAYQKAMDQIRGKSGNQKKDKQKKNKDNK